MYYFLQLQHLHDGGIYKGVRPFWKFAFLVLMHMGIYGIICFFINRKLTKF
jgi:hypothetical protein